MPIDLAHKKFANILILWLDFTIKIIVAVSLVSHSMEYIDIAMKIMYNLIKLVSG